MRLRERRTSYWRSYGLRDVIPRDLESFPNMKLPKAIRHPDGFSIFHDPLRQRP